MLSDRLTRALDPAYAAWLVASNPPAPPDVQPSLAQLRAGFALQVALSNGAHDPRIAIEDTDLPVRDGRRVTVRCYRPAADAAAAPLCLFVHGGGWVLGDLDTHDGVAHDLALRTGATVISVDYRRAPEHPFPAPLDDVEDVLRHLHAHAADLHIDPQRVALVGDSAGGGLAAAAALRLRGQPGAPAALALVYPGLGADLDRPSFIANRDVPGLTPELMTFFFTSYLGGSTTLPDPLAAPLSVEDLSGLPPTWISVARFDPLMDDGTEFAQRLSEAGVPVTLREEAALGHGYLWVRRVSAAAAAAFDAQTAWLADRIGSAPR